MAAQRTLTGRSTATSIRSETGATSIRLETGATSIRLVTIRTTVLRPFFGRGDRTIVAGFFRDRSAQLDFRHPIFVVENVRGTPLPRRALLIWGNLVPVCVFVALPCVSEWAAVENAWLPVTGGSP